MEAGHTTRHGGSSDGRTFVVVVKREQGAQITGVEQPALVGVRQYTVGEYLLEDLSVVDLLLDGSAAIHHTASAIAMPCLWGSRTTRSTYVVTSR